jgi:hypothetical protein
MEPPGFPGRFTGALPMIVELVESCCQAKLVTTRPWDKFGTMILQNKFNTLVFIVVE